MRTLSLSLFLLLVSACAEPDGGGKDTDGGNTTTDADGDGYTGDEGDCDDGDADINPDAAELCDGIDNDCDGKTDDDDTVAASSGTAYYADLDADTYGDPAAKKIACAQPDGYVADSTDCDDTSDQAFPGGVEVCDDLDNDCDGKVDNGVAEAPEWYADVDGDGYGQDGVPIEACDQPPGYAATNDDCNDGNADVHPDAAEPDCTDPVDYNCDGSAAYDDVDEDGWAACLDCADNDADRNPGMPEVCDPDDVDEDCSGAADDDDPGTTDIGTWYKDTDGDGYADDGATPVVSCDAPKGYADELGDCDDLDEAVNPAAQEVCDAFDVDEDCDGTADDADDSVDAGTYTTWYKDQDGDEYGNVAKSLAQCEAPDGYVDNAEDCDDTDETRNPGEAEVCDSKDVDEDCDGAADDADADVTGGSTWYADTDGDGYGDPTVAKTACSRPTGYVADANDCNDDDGAIHPGATEVCDAADTDEDCDGLVDDADGATVGRSTWYVDADGDTYGSVSGTKAACDQPSGYAVSNTDCNDAAAAINPGATEVCDSANTDEDCDGKIDDADSSATGKTTYYVDADADSYGGTTTATLCDLSAGYAATSTDCNDGDSTINPAATEVCDASNTDEDCDGKADDSDSGASGTSTWYRDQDGDTYGTVTTTSAACDQPAGYVADATDCDDAVSAVNPGAAEVCDASNTDEDCDGKSDDADTSATGKSTWYADGDGDTYGDSTTATTKCDKPSGYVTVGSDCNDGNSAINPAAAEVCDAANTDEDCDGKADDLDSSATGKTASYLDADDDGYGSTTSTTSCDLGSGYVSNHDDCNDGNDAINPGAAEICDAGSTDEDCDGYADDSDSSVSAATKSTWYVDADSDTYGSTTTTKTQCDKPSGYTATSTDCNDGNSAINPAATELCDAANTDEDCDGAADDADTTASGKLTYYPDSDGDLYGVSATAITRCDVGSGYATTGGDCADGDPAVNPGATETCDSLNVDEDCDGKSDDSDTSATGKSTVYRDADSDTYGGTTTATMCDLASGYVTNSTDCNDGVAAINPGAQEVCDSSNVDEDCDTYADDLDASVLASGKSTWYVDSDGDSYGIGTSAKACDKPAGYAAVNTDCDDSKSAVNPAATETCSTTYDDDCDTTANEAGSTGCVTYFVDMDGDGYGISTSSCLCAATGTYTATDDGDCNDADETRSPGEPEICGDGIDQDCSGADEICATHDVTEPAGDYDITWMANYLTGPTSSAYFGTSVGSGDVNGDGKTDILVGAYGYSYGYAYLYRGPYDGPGTYSNASASFYAGSSTYDDFGCHVDIVEDDDGLGQDDIVIGAQASSYQGYVFVYDGSSWGSSTSSVNYASANARWTGISSGDRLGTWVEDLGDFNDDGYGDVAVSAPYYSTEYGQTYIVYGPYTSGNYTISSVAGATISGSASNDYSGSVLSGGGYNNDDGYTDLFVSATKGNGYVYFFKGSASFASTKVTDTNADAIFVGEASGDSLGSSIDSTGDFNGDGIDDVVIGAYLNDEGGSSAGKAYVVFGPFSGTYAIGTDADVELIGIDSTDYAGVSVTFIDDLDGDGTDEIAVGAYVAGSSSGGETYLIYGGTSGTIDLSAADASFYSLTSGEYSGYRVYNVGDLDGDGTSDLGIENYGSSSYAGRLTIVPGELDYFNDKYRDYYSSASTTDATSPSTANAGNFNNSGGGEYWLGVPNATYSSTGDGVAYLLSSTGSSLATYYGPTSNADFGFDLDGGGFVNTDAYADSVISAPTYSQGYVYLLGGRATPVTAMVTTVATAYYYGESSADSFGYSVSLVNVDGDADDDVVVGAPYNDKTATSAGRAYVIDGLTTGQAATVATLIVSGIDASDLLGWSVDNAGDLDGDGNDEIILGAPYSGSGGTEAGEAYIVYGDTTGVLAASAADAALRGASSYSYAGTSVAGAGDVDGDGHDDVLVGAPYTDTVGTDSGTVYLLYGPVTGTQSLSSADVTINGIATGDLWGAALNGVGDVDNDGYGDFMVGSPNSDFLYTNGGRAAIYFGPEINLDYAQSWGVESTSYSAVGSDVNGLGDIDGDGYDDFGYTMSSSGAAVYLQQMRGPWPL